MNEPAGLRRSRASSERFARAIERGATHQDDAEFGPELAVVSTLRELAAEPTTDPAARDRMRERILATESTPLTADPGDAAVPRRPSSRRRGRGSVGLLITATAAGFLGLGVLSVQLASDALPGDFLYNIKRTTEAISLDLTFTEDGRAFKQLELASIRVSELAALVAEQDAERTGDTADPAVYRNVLDDFDSAASSGSRSVTQMATQSGASDLERLSDWATRQSERMSAIKAGMPGEVVGRFEASVDLLGKIERRAEALAVRISCDQITSGDVDALGALPARAACTAGPAAYDPLDLLHKDGGHASAPPSSPGPDTPAGEDGLPSAPGAPTVDPAPAPVDEPELPAKPPADVDDGIDTGDPQTSETLTVPTPTPPSTSAFPGLPTVDLP